MILDLIIEDTSDGYSSKIPSIKGCESWAHTEDESISKTIEFLRFYLNLSEETKIKIDKASKHKNKSVYKIIFNK